ncbi:MAG TPA: SIS domain-containing protein [Anaerolineales bacterium]|nr:SIS domain-containing protein [Anaerolineales bacterium]
MTLLHEEIHQQPSVIRALLDQEAGRARMIAAALKAKDPRYVVLAARGSSDNAARYGNYVFGSLLRLPVALATPSLYTLYARPPRLRQALVIGISQSGQSDDIVAVLSEARRQGAPTLAITNSPDSPLAAQADYLIETHAGEERSVAATKTYTSQLMALGLLVAGWLDDPALFADLAALPDSMRRTLELEGAIHSAALRYQHAEHAVVLGRGYNYATAFEIALKLKETCYLAAEPYSPADFLHGPVALVEAGYPAIVIAPSGAVALDLTRFAADLRERGASLLMISDQAQALRLADVPLELPRIPAEWTSPLLAILPGQLLSLHLAEARGLDPDRPRGLRKVTVTR